MMREPKLFDREKYDREKLHHVKQKVFAYLVSHQLADPSDPITDELMGRSAKVMSDEHLCSLPQVGQYSVDLFRFTYGRSEPPIPLGAEVECWGIRSHDVPTVQVARGTIVAQRSNNWDGSPQFATLDDSPEWEMLLGFGDGHRSSEYLGDSAFLSEAEALQRVIPMIDRAIRRHERRLRSCQEEQRRAIARAHQLLKGSE